MDRPLPVLFPVSLLFLLSVAPAVAVSQDFTKCLMQDGSVEYTDQTCPAGSTEVTLSSAARKEPPYESKSGAPAREVEEATRSIPVEEPEEVMARPGFAADADGHILGPSGTYPVRDAVVVRQAARGADALEIDFYGFRLSRRELQYAGEALVNRGGSGPPHRLELMFDGPLETGAPLPELKQAFHYLPGGDHEVVDITTVVHDLRLIRQDGQSQLVLGMKGKGRTGESTWDVQIRSRIKNVENIVQNVDGSSAGASSQSVQGTMRYDNAAIDNPGEYRAEMSVRNARTGQYVRGYEHHFDMDNGRYRLGGLPAGKYKISVSLVHPSSPDKHASRAGEYTGTTTVSLPHDGREAAIELQRLMQLTQPTDSGKPHPGRNHVLESPVTFRWLPLAEGARYEYAVTRVSADPSVRRTIKRETRGLTARLELDPGRYEFSVAGYRDGNRLGYLRVFSSQWQDTEYPFMVVSR